MSHLPGQHFLKRAIPRGLRNWLKSPGQTLRWVWDETQHKLGIDRTALIRPTWSLRCHPAAYRFACREQMEDLEQREELDTFIASASTGMILFDIGAHFGIFSFAALQHGGPTARAIAVDASPVAVRMMRTQSQLNHVDPDRFTVIRAMVGDAVGEGEMVAVGVIAGGYYVAPTDSHSAADRSRLRMTTVDELAKHYGVKPTHLKIDVEGAEDQVLRGAASVLEAPDGPIVYLELHNALIRQSGRYPEAILENLESYGYSVREAGNQGFQRHRVCSKDLVRLVARKNGINPTHG